MTFRFIARLLVYTFALVLGEIYLMLLIADGRWPRALRFVAIVSWGVLLGSVVSLSSFEPQFRCRAEMRSGAPACPPQ
jgi:hypothetical protein